MTQEALVQNVYQNGTAKILINRQTACGHDCSKCAGCTFAESQKLLVDAVNQAGAKPGDLVLVETETKSVLGAAVLLYLVPIILFFVGYGICSAVGLSYVLSCVMGGVGFAIGLIVAILSSRILKKNRKLESVITSIRRPSRYTAQ